MMRSQPSRITAAVEAKSGKMIASTARTTRSNTPRTTRSTPSARYQRECCLIVSRMALRKASAASSRDIDMTLPPLSRRRKVKCVRRKPQISSFVLSANLSRSHVRLHFAQSAPLRLLPPMCGDCLLIADLSHAHQSGAVQLASIRRAANSIGPPDKALEQGLGIASEVEPRLPRLAAYTGHRRSSAGEPVPTKMDRLCAKLRGSGSGRSTFSASISDRLAEAARRLP